MGILPLQFQAGQGWQQLGLTGAEEFDLANLRRGAFAGEPIEVRARRPGAEIAFTVTAQLLTESERSLIANGGLLPTVIRHFLDTGRPKRTSTSRGAAARNERSKTENT
jgi:aconitate hydratase